MKAMIQKVPVPLCGVMLGCAALGNLLQSYSEAVRYLFGIIAFLALVLLLLKWALYPTMVKEDLKNPIMLSVAATFPMGLMLLSVYAKPFLGGVSFFIWLAAILLHVALIVVFTMRFIIKLDIKKVFASYFIVYVGIAVAGITAPAYNMQALGAVAFWFGFVSLLALLVVVGYRYFKHPEVPEPARPLFCIFAAPTSLCLAAYIQSVATKSAGMVIFLFILATALYLLSLYKLLRLPKAVFFPSFASFTFPFVISAIAAKQATAFLTGAGYQLPLLPAVVLIETIIALVLVCYTLVRFCIFLFQPVQGKAKA